jgi:hypothetical protein
MRADQVVVVVAGSDLETSGRAGRLDTPQQAGTDARLQHV